METFRDIAELFNGVIILPNPIPIELQQKYLKAGYAIVVQPTNFTDELDIPQNETTTEEVITKIKNYNLSKVIHEIAGHLKEKTQQNYKIWATTLLSSVLINVDNFTTEQLKEKSEQIKQWIDAKAANSIKSSYAYILKSIYEHCQVKPNPWVEHYEVIQKEHADRVKYRELNDEEAEEIQKIDFNKMKEDLKKEKNADARLFMALYSYLPPLRQTEYANMKITRNADIKGDNYVDIEKGIMCICQQKSEVYGIRQFSIPQEVIDEVKLYATKLKTDTLFKGYDSSRFNKITLRKLKIRKFNHLARITFITNGMKHWNAEERKKMAYIMDHLPETQAIIYDKSST